MSHVEQRIEIALLPRPLEKPSQEYEIVKVPEKTQIVTWFEQLALLHLCQEELVEIAGHIKARLVLEPSLPTRATGNSSP